MGTVVDLLPRQPVSRALWVVDVRPVHAAVDPQRLRRKCGQAICADEMSPPCGPAVHGRITAKITQIPHLTMLVWP